MMATTLFMSSSRCYSVLDDERRGENVVGELRYAAELAIERALGLEDHVGPDLGADAGGRPYELRDVHEAGAAAVHGVAPVHAHVRLEHRGQAISHEAVRAGVVDARREVAHDLGGLAVGAAVHELRGE